MTQRPRFVPARPGDVRPLPERPVWMAERPDPCFRNSRSGALRMDPLSDVLRAVKLNGAYFYLVEAGAPWSVAARPSRDLRPLILPEAEHLFSYHILLTGHCWAGVEGDGQVLMKPGDVVVFPHGDAHF